MPIETRLISAGEEGWLSEAEQVLRRGGLVAFPTDTVYGLAARAVDAAAVGRIFAAKGRPQDRSIPVLVGGWAEVVGVALGTPRAEQLAAVFWPGPLTIVLPRAHGLPAEIGPAG
ncbi:MAG TPA: Sua5/YciO/YrdC/YwlC family protein, partial [Anaerolineales bacterium]|nr:Sua5/YciO/YrdC/YwlC family protein [Anaerolineales bacterium]